MATTDTGNAKGLRPWEDVWTGLALAWSAQGAGLTSMHMGSALYQEGWDRKQPISTQTLLWHAGTFKGSAAALHDHIIALHRLKGGTVAELDAAGARDEPAARAGAGEDHCASSGFQVNCGRGYVSCTGASWLRCLAVHNSTDCPRRRLSLPGAVNLTALPAGAGRHMRRGGAGEAKLPTSSASAAKVSSDDAAIQSAVDAALLAVSPAPDGTDGAPGARRRDLSAARKAWRVDFASPVGEGTLRAALARAGSALLHGSRPVGSARGTASTAAADQR